MKIKGQKLYKRAAAVIVFPRVGGDLVFKAGPVVDDREFLELCPEPTKYQKIFPGGKRVEDLDNKDYKESIKQWGRKKLAWLVLKSLEYTDDLEWDDIDMQDSNTWTRYEDELKEAGFSNVEQVALVNTVMDACGLNQSKITEATERFLAENAAALDVQSSQDIEVVSTTSGVLANESE